MSPNPQFTPRELEVIELLLEGKSNKQIAAALNIVVRTVEFHLNHIYEKLEVSSRFDALGALWELRGTDTRGKQGESTVDFDSNSIHNRDNLNKLGPVGATGTDQLMAGGCLNKFGNFMWLLILGLLTISVLIITLVLSNMMPTETWRFERECEFPEAATVGQLMERPQASNGMTHGQFGTHSTPPWDPKSGQVIYENIATPRIEQLSLNLRYSKHSSASVSILVFIDNETKPRAAIFPDDQEDWNRFAWTGPSLIGPLEGGEHTLRFVTEGQQYGVADLDKFILSEASQ